MRWLRRLISHTECVEGITVAVTAVEPESIAAYLRSAIELIRLRDPYRLKMLRKYLVGGIRVNLAVISGRAEFNAKTLSCMVDPSYASSEVRPEELAATLVHEATHARLSHLGFKYENARSRVREEAVCLRQEIAFARRLPDGDELAESAERRLASLDPSDYDDAAFDRSFVAHRLRLARRTRMLGVPGWFLRGGGCVAKALKRTRKV
jgi:hypothetical protein